MKQILLFTLLVLSSTTLINAQTNNTKGAEYLKFFQGTFASTPKNGMWIKITIKDRNVTIWSSNPYEGKWGNPKSCTIKENTGCLVCTGRNSDGSKYYSILTDGCESESPFFLDIFINYCPSCSYEKYTYQFGQGGATLTKVPSNYMPWD